MLTGTYIETKTLSRLLQNVLKGVGYGARDIQVMPSSTADLSVAAGDGTRGFAVLVNLDTGETKRFTGSWGGTNMFVRTAVDDSDGIGALPPNGCVVKGTTGYPRTFAYIYVHPSAMGKFLPGGETEELTDIEQQAIYCFCAIKGGEYRREELRRRRVSTETVESLVSRGYLKRNKAGAIQATTKAKNARTVRF